MTKKEKAIYIVEQLERLYPETPIPLDHSDPYTLLIAVLLSAQCTDEPGPAAAGALPDRPLLEEPGRRHLHALGHNSA